MSEYWKNRGRMGEEREYASPYLLLKKAYEYFSWCADNPLVKQDLIKSGARQGEMVEVPIGRPLTQLGLCVYCGIGMSTFDTYASNDVFAGAVDHIRNVIAQHLTEGALLGIYNTTVVNKLQQLDLKEGESHYQPFQIIVADKHTEEQIRILERNAREVGGT